MTTEKPILQLGCITDGDGNELDDVAIIFIGQDEDDGQIEVRTKNAKALAEAIIRAVGRSAA